MSQFRSQRRSLSILTLLSQHLFNGPESTFGLSAGGLHDGDFAETASAASTPHPCAVEGDLVDAAACLRRILKPLPCPELTEFPSHRLTAHMPVEMFDDLWRLREFDS